MVRGAYLAAEEAYDPNPANFDSWTLVANTPTVKAFQKGSSILLAIRGTNPTSWVDIKADLSIPFNRLKYSQRYKGDKRIVLELAKRFPPAKYVWTFAGHSLGNAIGLQLQRDFPFIQAGVGFNGALEPVDLLQQPPQTKEFYVAQDPLYRMAGQFWENKQVISPAELQEKDDVFTALKAHKLEQFKHMFQ